MAILKPDNTFTLNGVKINEYLLTKHNPNHIDMPSVSMEGKVIGITVHNTEWISVASGTTPAEQYTRATYNGNMKDVRVHYYVDNTCAWQNLPLSLSGWHAADGSGNGNRRTIAIECIMSSAYNDKDKKSEDNCARLAAALLKKYGLDINHLYTHTHWLNVRDGKSGTVDYLNTAKNSYKNCPAYILPHWSEFKKKVESYGYMRDDDGNMIINPKEADTIRYIFQSVLNGFGTDKIAKTLDARKIPTRKGGKWSGATVRDILCNEKYYGAAAFQKTYTDENFHRKRNYGEVDSFFDPEHHEPIISKNVFDRVREIIDRRATEKNVVSGDDKYQQRYVFSGKIICGECGDKFRRKIHDSGKEIAWSCRTHIQNIEKCSMKYVRDDMLKAAFVNMMNKLIYARKRLLIPLYENLSIQECDENINRIHALQAELQKMSDKKETLRKLRAQDIIDSIVFNQEMNGLESTSEEYRNEIRNLCSETNDYTELKKLIQFTNREMLTEFTDEIFEKYVSNIVIVNRNTAEFHLKCGLKIKEAL